MTMLKLIKREIDHFKKYFLPVNTTIELKEGMLHWYFTNYTRSPFSMADKQYSIYILTKEELPRGFNDALGEVIEETFSDIRGYDAIHDKLRSNGIKDDEYQMFVVWKSYEVMESIRD